MVVDRAEWRVLGDLVAANSAGMAASPEYHDEDDIALTSTASERYDSDTEFLVERVLAEKESKGKKFFLIAWQDYPIEKATWEPEKNMGPEILGSWQERKQLEDQGSEKPFDVDQWTMQVEKLEHEKADRKRRRAAKRKRIIKAKLEAMATNRAVKREESDKSSSEAVEENEFVDSSEMKNRGTKKRKKKASVGKPPLKLPAKVPSIDKAYAVADQADAVIEERPSKKAGKAKSRASKVSPFLAIFHEKKANRQPLDESELTKRVDEACSTCFRQRRRCGFDETQTNQTKDRG